MSDNEFLFCHDCGSVLVDSKCPHCASKVSDMNDDVAFLAEQDLSHLPKEQQQAIMGITRWYKKVIHPATNADATRYDIDTATEQGQFELFCLALLLSAGKPREESESAFKRLRARGLMNFKQICTSEDHQDITSRIVESLHHLPEGQAESFGKRIVISALKISRELDNKLSGLYELYRQSGDRVITILAETEARGGSYGLADKAFWLTREMKQANLWLVDGEFCCASESPSLKRLLERIGFEVPLERRPVPRMLRISKLIWSYFGEDYDIPAVAFVEQVCQDDPDCPKCPISRYCNHGKAALEADA
ncbi:MAG: hypothetical protein ACXADX_16575 [Candidatus Hodarchaeales archaeon]